MKNIMISMALAVILSGCGDNSGTPFIRLCRDVVDQPSQNIMVIVESQYYDRQNDDALSELEIEEFGRLSESLIGLPVERRDYSMYRYATSTLLRFVLRGLDSTGALEESKPVDLYNTEDWRQWYAAHKGEIERLEQGEPYRAIVRRTLRE